MQPVDLPLFPLYMVLFPGMLLPLHIFEDRYKKMVADCLKTSTPFGVVLIRSGPEAGPPAEPFPVGTTAIIAKVEQLADGRLNLIAVGENRFRVEDIVQVHPYYVARVHYIHDEDADSNSETIRRLARELGGRFSEYVGLVLSSLGRTTAEIELPKRPDLLTHVISAAIGIPLLEKQKLLEMTSVEQRLKRALGLVTRQNVELKSFQQSMALLEGHGDPFSSCPFSLN